MRYFGFNSTTKFSVVLAGVGIVKDVVHIRHTRDDYELFVVTDGDLSIEQDGCKYHLQVGDYLIVECRKEFGGYDESTGRFLWLHFTCDGSGGMFDSPCGELAFPQYGHLDRFDLVVVEHTLLNNYFLLEWKKPVTDAMCLTLMCDIATMVAPKHEAYDNDYRFQAVMEYLMHNPYFNEFDDVKSMAEYFGYSEKYMYDLFKRKLMLPPRRYINMQKIQRAMSMLVGTDMTVKSIAATLHYDYYYFMRLFKKETGMSPTQYRKTVVPNYNGPTDDDIK